MSCAGRLCTLAPAANPARLRLLITPCSNAAWSATAVLSLVVLDMYCECMILLPTAFCVAMPFNDCCRWWQGRLWWRQGRRRLWRQRCVGNVQLGTDSNLLQPIAQLQSHMHHQARAFSRHMRAKAHQAVERMCCPALQIVIMACAIATCTSPSIVSPLVPLAVHLQAAAGEVALAAGAAVLEAGAGAAAELWLPPCVKSYVAAASCDCAQDCHVAAAAASCICTYSYSVLCQIEGYVRKTCHRIIPCTALLPALSVCCCRSSTH
jgi:hypothetical protein